MVPNSRQALIWSNFNPDVRHRTASLDPYDLMLCWDIFYLLKSIIRQAIGEIEVGFNTHANMTSRNFAENESCYVHHGTSGNKDVTAICHQGSPVQARYVWVYLPVHNQELALCEVEVYRPKGKYPQLPGPPFTNMV